MKNKKLGKIKGAKMKPYKMRRTASISREPGLPDGFTAFTPIYTDPQNRVSLYKADCVDFLNRLADANPHGCVDMIFADPPYFLSNGGISCQSGKMVSVNKGAWDKSKGPEQNHEFNRKWLAACQRVLKPNGTIWVSGTSHVIYSVGFAMQQLGYKILNDITWVKPNPPPNLSCRYFTHAAETVIWAAKTSASRHVFHYHKMRELAGGKQMRSVWDKIYPPDKNEKALGKHPTQKPIKLLRRILLANSNKEDVILDPFMGSGTTGVAAVEMGRRFIGVDLEQQYLSLAIGRIKHALSHPENQKELFELN